MSLSTLPFVLPPALESALRLAYATPPRAYHHFGHVEEVLVHWASVASWLDPVATACAVLFHDAVYESGRSNNEAKIALLARRLIAEHLGPLRVDVARVEALIELTARHGRLAPGDVDADAALFLDCDMAILGAAEARFDEYDRSIREEHAIVPEVAYRAGRAAFLRRVLDGRRIFLSDSFHERLDAAARANLGRALKRLGG